MPPRLAAVTLLLVHSLAASAGTVIRVVSGLPEIRPDEVTLSVRGPAGERNLRARFDTPVMIDDLGPVMVQVTESAAWWSPSISLSGDSVVEIPVWPATELRGRVAVQNGVDLPRLLEAGFDLERGSAAARFKVDCPVQPGGRWRCRVPEAKLDVRLSAPGFAPHYLWDLVPSRERALDITPFTMKRGASVAGWVGTEKPDTTFEQAVVRVMPNVYAGAPEDEKILSYKEKPNNRGFFQFTDVPAGDWLVMAEAPGFSPSRVVEITLDERNESTLRDVLRLRPLADLEVNIQPTEFPPGRHWTVHLNRRNHRSRYLQSVAKSAANDQGQWSITGIAVGEYVLEVMDARGAVFSSSRIEVEPGMQALQIAITAVPVKGRVQIGDEGVAASVKFYADRGENVTATSDASGNFKMMLPFDGRWRVDVRLSATGQELTLRSVQVARKEDAGYADLVLKLPGARISGRAADENGQPMAAGIIVTRNGSPIADIFSEDGTFDLVGLEPGQATIMAGTERMSSETLAVVIDTQTPPVTLVLRAETKLDLWITTADGNPVAGAVVRYRTAASPFMGETVSSPAGRCVLRLEPNATAVNVAIVAHGFPAKLSLIPVPESRRVNIVVHRGGGRLIVPIRDETPPWPAVGHEGAWVSLLDVLPPFYGGVSSPSWRTQQGMVVHLEPGEYLICAERQPPSGCVQQRVVMGTSTVVDLPHRAPQARKETQ